MTLDPIARAIAELCDAITDVTPTDTSQIATPLAAIELATLTIRKLATETRAPGGPTPEQRARMCHAIGWWRCANPASDPSRAATIPAGPRPYRNYYAADPTDSVMRAIASRGWMNQRMPDQRGGLIYYAVTPEGFTALGLPIPHPETARARREGRKA